MITTLALKKEPIYVGVDDDKEMATVEGLQQGYVACPSEKRFLLLFTFLKKNKKKKMMVFFSSCMSVKYHHELLNYIDLPVMSIHVRHRIDLSMRYESCVTLSHTHTPSLSLSLSSPLSPSLLV